MKITNIFLADYIETTLTISIAFIGIGLTLFTLFYAFIGNKKDELKSINERISKEGNSMSILRKRNSAMKFINKMLYFNHYSILLLITSLISTFITFVLKFCIDSILECYYLYIFIILSAFLFFSTTILMLLIIKMLRHYNSYTNPHFCKKLKGK